MVNVWLSSYLVHYEAEPPVSFTDKRVKKGTYDVRQKKPPKAKKGSDADSDVSSEGDGYLDSQEEVYTSDSFESLDGEIFQLTFSSAISVFVCCCCCDLACFFSHPSSQTLWSLSKDIFEQRTSTGSEALSLLICLDAYNQFVC